MDGCCHARIQRRHHAGGDVHNKLIGPGLGEGPMWWLLVFCSVIESLRFKQLGLGFECDECGSEC